MVTRRVRAALATLLPATLTGCIPGSLATVNIELAVTIVAPDRVYRATNVFRVQAWRRFWILPDENKQKVGLTGHPFCLRNRGGVILVLLGTRDNGRRDLGVHMLGTLERLDETPTNYWSDTVRKYAAQADRLGPVEMGERSYPILLTMPDGKGFDDMTAVRSGRRFSAFGQEHEIRSVTVRPTRRALSDADADCLARFKPHRSYDAIMHKMPHFDPRRIYFRSV